MDDWLDERVEEVICADCLEAMRDMPEGSVDAIVTDPPYGLEFMGKEWDAPWRSDPHVGKTWSTGMGEVSMADGYKRIPRPRFESTQNVRCRRCGKWRLSSNPCRCERPDFPNIKLSNMRTFQQYMTPIFAEALRVAKPGAHLLCFGGTRTFHRMACAIEDAGWEVRDCIMWVYGSGFPKSMDVGRKLPEWDGWGTCLKPAWEPIIVARKPLEGTVANNVMKHGTGALNIDACRVPTEPHDSSRDGEATADKDYTGVGTLGWQSKPGPRGGDERGRFPANLVHDGSDEVRECFPDAKGQQGDLRAGIPKRPGVCYGDFPPTKEYAKRDERDASAARFFYCAKASKRERGEGNNHPTVKPLALMEWLVRLVTPEGSIVLDPFCGSGSTLVAAKRLGREFIGIERDTHYCDIARGRLRKEDE